MILGRLEVERDEFLHGTGWDLRPEGACSGDVCVVLSPDTVAGDAVDVEMVARQLAMPLVHDEEHGLWALGPASVTGRALTTAEAPDLVLPDLDGNPFSLSSLRGQKVVLTTWASW